MDSALEAHFRHQVEYFCKADGMMEGYEEEEEQQQQEQEQAGAAEED